ncbi:MAG: Na+/H+ antiporter NhaC family protein [Planctomycetota bacterium]
MIRALALVVFAGLVAVLLLAEGASPSLLTAKQAGDLLLVESPVTDEDGSPVFDDNGEPVTRPLWQDVLESPAVVETEDGRVLQLGGSFFRSELTEVDEPFDFLWHSHAGKSIVRRLRSIVADKDLGIEVPAVKKPIDGGVNFELLATDDEITLEANVDGESLGERTKERRRISQLSLLPPLVAIFLAILFRRPVPALFAGVWVGAFLVRKIGGDGLVTSTGGSLVDTFTVYLRGQLEDHARTEIILFVVFMLAMVGVITRAGGILGMMQQIAVLARSARQTQFATWLMGLTVFFDDYANTILVGSTMRPLADRFRVSREKLAYIVDSTAAPVAGVSILSTWIAFEVSTFSAQLPDAGLGPGDGYAVFLQTLPFRFYCWFTLAFVGLNVWMGRDFGSMLKAEKRARGGQLLREGATPLVGKAATELEADASVTPRASTALVPLAVFVLTVLGMIIVTGAQGIGLFDGTDTGGFLETATGILYAGSGNRPLMFGAIAGFVVAAIFALMRGLSLPEILVAALNSLRAMFIAIVILYLAWMVGKTCEDLGTAAYLSATLTETIPYMVLPVVLFLLSGIIAFSTGSSWSTMTILLPLVVGLSYDIGYAGTPAELDPRAFGLALMVVSIGAVLEGAIFGDHCSPISDTTVMSSIACASDHIDHVRTQAPYAILTMLVAILIGYFPVTFLQVSPWVVLPVGIAFLALVLVIKGRKVADPVAAEAT